jgi:hypothetical protein
LTTFFERRSAPWGIHEEEKQMIRICSGGKESGLLIFIILQLLILPGLSCVTPPEDDGPDPPRGKPLPSGQVIQSVGFASSSIGWIVTQPGLTTDSTNFIYKTVDSGKTWWSQYGIGWPGAIVLQRLFVVNELDVWAVGNGGYIFHTIDGGEEWSEYVVPNIDGMQNIRMVNSTEGWALGWNLRTHGCGAGNNFVLHTTDAGTTWWPSYAASNGSVDGIAFVGQHVWVVGGGLGEAFCPPLILHSSSGGATWSQQYADGLGNLKDVAFVNDQVGFAVGMAFEPSRTFIRTTNGGQSWDTVGHAYPDTYPMQLCLMNDSLLYFVTQSYTENKAAILRSTNHGQSFTIDLELPRSTSILAAFFLNDSTGWAVGSRSLVKRKVGGIWLE